MRLQIEIDRETALKLAVLSLPEVRGLRPKVLFVIQQLIDHAQQGVYRPGAWERGWVSQAFGDEWLEELMPDTSRLVNGQPIFDRPIPTIDG